MSTAGLVSMPRLIRLKLRHAMLLARNLGAIAHTRRTTASWASNSARHALPPRLRPGIAALLGHRAVIARLPHTRIGVVERLV